MPEQDENTNDEIKDEFHEMAGDELAAWLDSREVKYAKPTSKVTLLTLCRAIKQVEDLKGSLAGMPGDDADLVSVWKEGDELRVHPTCVAAHVEQGWKVKG